MLGAAPGDLAGIASGVNNAVARAAQLLAVAALPVAVGLSGDDYTQPGAFTAGFRSAMVVCAVLFAVGGGRWRTIHRERVPLRNRARKHGGQTHRTGTGVTP